MFFAIALTDLEQGCQMAYLQTKSTNLGKLWSELQRKMLAYFLPFGVFYGHSVYVFGFMVLWYIFHHFGMFCQEKSGNF
jgi:hypothetical protein